MFDGEGYIFLEELCVVYSDVFVIIVSVCDVLLEWLKGLDFGVDDFLVKLFFVDEFIVCLCVVLCWYVG